MFFIKNFFLNIRVNKNDKLTICMAVDTNGKAMEAMQRTSTLEFMAKGILNKLVALLILQLQIYILAVPHGANIGT